ACCSSASSRSRVRWSSCSRNSAVDESAIDTLRAFRTALLRTRPSFALSFALLRRFTSYPGFPHPNPSETSSVALRRPRGDGMSALGQKQTFCGTKRHVRFAPESDRESGLRKRGHVRFTPKSEHVR